MIKRILSATLVLCLVAALALAAGCTEGGSGNAGSKSTGSKSGTGTGSVTVDDVYGAGLSEDEITALQNSGTITLYTDKSNLVKGEPNEDQKDEYDFYKKYYGLTIKWKYQAWGDNLTKFMVDYANNDAPDFIELNYRRWPKAGTRKVVFSLDELREKGVVGLDHPQITRYNDIASRFCIGKTLYSAGVNYVDPSVCAYNVELFDQYKVKSPGEYYAECTWDLDAYVKCAKELTRTLSDGTKIWGGFWRDHTYYLVADDARLVDWNEDGTKLVLNMSKTSTIKALEVWMDTYLNGYSPKPSEGGSDAFGKGQMGMFICDVNNYASKAVDYTFKWDIVPTPLGSHNVSGQIPGECSGNGVVDSSKNPQGVINYCIAVSLYREARYNQKYGVYYLPRFSQGVYNEKQLEMILPMGDHIGLDLYMGVSDLYSIQYRAFWDPLKDGKMSVKETIDAYENEWQEMVNEENQAMEEARKK